MKQVSVGEDDLNRVVKVGKKMTDDISNELQNLLMEFQGRAGKDRTKYTHLVMGHIS